MTNKNAENCWEYWGCDPFIRQSCPVYCMNMGKECWVISNSFTRFVCNESASKKSKNCWDCAWFKLMSNRFRKEE